MSKDQNDCCYMFNVDFTAPKREFTSFNNQIGNYKLDQIGAHGRIKERHHRAVFLCPVKKVNKRALLSCGASDTENPLSRVLQ